MVEEAEECGERAPEGEEGWRGVITTSSSSETILRGEEVGTAEEEEATEVRWHSALVGLRRQEGVQSGGMVFGGCFMAILCILCFFSMESKKAFPFLKEPLAVSVYHKESAHQEVQKLKVEELLSGETRECQTGAIAKQDESREKCMAGVNHRQEEESEKLGAGRKRGWVLARMTISARQWKSPYALLRMGISSCRVTELPLTMSDRLMAPGHTFRFLGEADQLTVATVTTLRTAAISA